MLTSAEPFVSRSAIQATARKFWVFEAADYLVERGIYPIHELPWAMAHAKRLASLNTDEGGELMVSPREAVDEDLEYEPS